METLFKNYKIINYKGMFCRDIMSRSKFIDGIIDNFDVWYTHIIKDGERPDTLANLYYGDSYLDWVILMANKITDPVDQWPVEASLFDSYVEAKFGTDVESIKSKVSHYVYAGKPTDTEENIKRTNWKVDAESYSLMEVGEREGWFPVYLYSEEEKRNEAKRRIRILSEQYIPQLKIEISRVMS